MAASTRLRDLLLACLLAALLSAAWTINDWERLRAFVLPDNDDVMRLAQIRDWIAGQALNDWTQYRLAHGGPMHWSRVNDAIPAAMILALRPLLGGEAAELATIVGYPALLFVACLLLVARIARRIGGDAAGVVAAIVMALAYPANAIFLPGRIDHHALQIVLVLGAVLAAMRPASAGSGLAIGGTIAFSLVIGLETGPHAAALMVVLFVRWVLDPARERRRALGLGIALGLVTLAFLLFARPRYWSETWCDSFTPASASAALVIAGWWLAIGAGSAWLRTSVERLLAGGGLAAVAGAALLWRYPGCLGGPYAAMEPFVRRAFMGHVGEAQPLFAGSLFGTALPSGGVMLAGLIAAAWLFACRPERRAAMAPPAAVFATCACITLFQIRGAYLGAALAAPFAAQIVVAARGVAGLGRFPALAAAWAAAGGIVHLSLGQWIERQVAPAGPAAFAANQACKTGRGFASLRAYPAGLVMAPIDWGAYVIGATPHGAIAAGYHRNNAGNLAGYAFFLNRPDAARRIAARWRARYVLICPGDFGELDVQRAYPHSLAVGLLQDRPPPWLRRLPLQGTGLRFYAIVAPSDLQGRAVQP